ncbi:MAG: Maltose acetyltransferase [Cirrosporium novae-zelandiae]|nr:MAG: Maltose acetyltransferase [Cirrosporium novae-zelandiae]
MAAVVTKPATSNSPLGKDRDRDSHDSGFTAVNDRNALSPPNGLPRSPLNGLPGSPPRREEQPTDESAPNHHDDRQNSLPKENTAHSNGTSNVTSSSQAVSVVVSPHKRKLSDTDASNSGAKPFREFRKSPDGEKSPESSTHSNSPSSHSPEREASYAFLRTQNESERPASDADQSIHTPSHPAWGPYSTPQASMPSQSIQHRSDPSDARLAEVLQQANNQSYPNNHARFNEPSPQTDDDHSRMSSYGAYGPDHHPEGHSDKPRKRAFANRTKTGCLTCRRRKKKCDEAKPVCQNCVRGHFKCEGYQPKMPQKTPTQRGPMPLQPSKTVYQDSLPTYTPDGANFAHPTDARGSDGSRGRPVMVNDDQDGIFYQTSPSSRTSYSTRPSFSAPSNSYPPENVQRPNEYPPPLPGYGRPEARTSIPSFHEIANTPQSDGRDIYPSASRFQQPPTLNTSLSASSSQATAKMALAQVAEPSLTERQNMEKGMQYHAYSQELFALRERCKKALWRFNNEPPYNNKADCRRLFLEILHPTASDLPRGTLGDNSVVEGPFYCDYGYNLQIGTDVVIETGCRFHDAAPIKIGDRTTIGSGVTILANTMSPNQSARFGINGPSQAAPVIIEQSCVICANVTIMPGVTIKTGSYIAPGRVIESTQSSEVCQEPWKNEGPKM